MTKIESGAFDRCSEFNANLILGTDLKTIEEDAFRGISFNRVYCKAVTPPYLSSYFSWNNYIGVPIGSLEAYKNAPGWKSYSNIEETEF